MSTTCSCLIALALLPLAAPAAAVEEPAGVAPLAPEPEVKELPRLEPPPPPPDDRPSPPRREDMGPGPRPPQPPGFGPGPWGGRPPGGPPWLDDPDRARMARRGGPPRLWQPMVRILAERRPELAERLKRLRRKDPELFAQVLMDAFMVRLEKTLDEAEANLRRHERHAGDQPPSHVVEMERHMRELQERHERLELRSHELAEKLRRLRTEEARHAERERLRDELADAVNEQFDVRTELRRAELERIEHELRRLRENVERLRHGLEVRERERGAIIERRMEELVGDDLGGW